MIIEIPDDNSIVKWKKNDKEDWKSAEISDLIKAYEERLQGDLISREALREHKFLSPQFKVIGGRRCGKTREQIIEAYQKGWNDCIDAIIDNAPTVCGNNPKWCESCVSKGKCASTRPQGDCEKCDFRKFAETFVDAIVEVMNKNGITSLEQLSEMLKDGAE